VVCQNQAGRKQERPIELSLTNSAHEPTIRTTKGTSEMSEELQQLIEATRGIHMSDAEKEAQRRSFAYGNAHIENERVTRAMVDSAAEKIGKHS
jgi:hypothetical protein